MKLEFHQLDRRYEPLRVRHPQRQRQLLASLAASGQQTPILVVAMADPPDRYLVVDGYKRIVALEQLGRDTVEAVLWPLSEVQALVLVRALRWSQPDSALEEGWLLAEQAPALQPRVMAVAFEDWTSAGDPQWLSKLHGRRKAAYDEIKAVTERLNQALAQNEPNEQIISALNDMKNSLKTSMLEFEARSAAGLVIETTVSNLERGGVQGFVGDPQKTIPATVFPIFAEWHGALKRFDNGIS